MKKNLITVGIVLVLIVAAFYVFKHESTAPDLSMETNETSMMVDVNPNIEVSEVAYFNDTMGYLAQPKGEGPFPAVILIHEWWGLNENIEVFAQRFAEQGYVALAVDLYNGESATTREEAGALAGSVRGNIAPAFDNLNAAVSYLKEQSNVKPESLASVGWCFGGQWSYEMAVNNLGVDASIMYYGQFDPEDDFQHMKATILGHFGEEDRSIPVDEVEEFQAVLNTLEGEHAVYIYPNAGHAFANEDNEEAYNEEAAELSWTRTLEFLEQYVD